MNDFENDLLERLIDWSCLKIHGCCCSDKKLENSNQISTGSGTGGHW